MTNNRRSDERVSTNLPAKWSGVTGDHEGRIEDLSLGGCFVNTTARADVGEVVSLEIKLPSGEWLDLRGEVTSYQIGIGFGLLFSFLTDEEEQTVRELIG
jgi:PilZ domain